MTKNQKRKDRKLQQLPQHMVAAGMTHVATVFAAVTSAARRRKWFHEIRGIQGVRALFLDRDGVLTPCVRLLLHPF